MGFVGTFDPYMEIDWEKCQIVMKWFYKIAWLTDSDFETIIVNSVLDA